MKLDYDDEDGIYFIGNETSTLKKILAWAFGALLASALIILVAAGVADFINATKASHAHALLLEDRR